jgi:hypothetical protein
MAINASVRFFAFMGDLSLSRFRKILGPRGETPLGTVAVPIRLGTDGLEKRSNKGIEVQGHSHVNKLITVLNAVAAGWLEELEH